MFIRVGSPLPEGRRGDVPPWVLREGERAKEEEARAEAQRMERATRIQVNVVHRWSELDDPILSRLATDEVAGLRATASRLPRAARPGVGTVGTGGNEDEDEDEDGDGDSLGRRLKDAHQTFELVVPRDETVIAFKRRAAEAHGLWTPPPTESDENDNEDEDDGERRRRPEGVSAPRRDGFVQQVSFETDPRREAWLGPAGRLMYPLSCIRVRSWRAGAETMGPPIGKEWGLQEYVPLEAPPGPSTVEEVNNGGAPPA